MSTPKRIVIAEDDADLGELLSYNLQRAGYEVDLAKDGRSGLHKIQESIPDLVVLDVMLPHLSGLQIAREIRTNPKTAQIPILMLTAKAEEMDQLAGLQVGADDYVTKPFSMKVLLARVEALLRRTKGGGETQAGLMEFKDIRIDLSTHEVVVRGEPVKLTLTEFRMLVALVRSKGKVLSRSDLMYTAIGPDVLVTTRTIDVHVAAIRRKLGATGQLLRTVRGVGYLLDANATAADLAADAHAEE